MDTAAQWPSHQDIVVKPMEEIVTCPKERKARPQALNCPRCNSTNTKFCYYNNYSLTQPRYFCKTCRRYWTEGGSLRNIPVGGGSRKNKRSNLSKKLPELVHENPKNVPQPQDLNLGFSIPSPNHLDLLTRPGLGSFMPDPASVYSSPFPNLPDFKPSLDFSLDGLGSNYASFQGVQPSNGGKLLFPFQDLKHASSNDQHNREEDNHNPTTGYWNGVMGGASW